MRIAICDDDEKDISHIVKLITKYQITREMSIDFWYFTNSTDFLCDLKSREYDLVLLDVLMPGASGIQAAQELRELELSVQAEEGLILRSRDGIVWIAFSKLVYVEVINKTLFFHLPDGTVSEMTAALADYEERLLQRPEFLKTHRSYLVNLSYIQAVEHNCVRMKTGHSLPISRQRHSKVWDAYMHFLQQSGTKDAISAFHEQKRSEGPWRILLVDDDLTARSVWSDILKNHGCIVDLVDNGKMHWGWLGALTILQRIHQENFSGQKLQHVSGWLCRSVHSYAMDPFFWI